MIVVFVSFGDSGYERAGGGSMLVSSSRGTSGDGRCSVFIGLFGSFVISWLFENYHPALRRLVSLVSARGNDTFGFW